MASTPSTYFLTKVDYSGEKRRITAEFSNKERKVTKNYDFFPVLLLDKRNFDEKTIYELIPKTENNSFQIIPNCKTIKIIGKNYSKLQEIYRKITEKKAALLLEPERQFLLLNNWGYFDLFYFENDQPVKDPAIIFPVAKQEFLLEPLDETFIKLHSKDKKAAMQLVRFIISSNLLKLPLQKIPLRKKFQLEVMLQNRMFLEEDIIRASNNVVLQISNETVRGKFSSLIELDFSIAWFNVLISKNLGSETNNCTCCKPETMHGENILPNSLVKARFLVDAFYYDSVFHWFSQKFHLGNENKQGRLERQREFSTKNIPIGPFFSNDTCMIPLADAEHLAENNFAEILPNENSLKWVCVKEKSLLCTALEELKSKADELNGKVDNYEKTFVHRYNLNAYYLLEHDLNYLFIKKYSNLLDSLISYVPRFVMSPKSAFYDCSVAESFRALQNAIIYKWKSSLSNGSRLIALDKFCNKAFVEANYLDADFFAKNRILAPICQKHHKTVYF